MKRILSLFFVAVTVLSLTACNPQTELPSEENQQKYTYNSARVGRGTISYNYVEIPFYEDFFLQAETVAVVEILEYLHTTDLQTQFSAKIQKHLYGEKIEQDVITVSMYGTWRSTIPGWPLYKEGDLYLAFMISYETEDASRWYVATHELCTLQIFRVQEQTYVVSRGISKFEEGPSPVAESLALSVKEEMRKADPVLEGARMSQVFEYDTLLNYLEELTNEKRKARS